MLADVDLLIVGAGWHGLAMAKTYKEATDSENKKILLIDEAETIGGTWALERLYPGLKTNNIVGTYEFSDFPLVPSRYGIKEGQHIPGKVVHQYLADFAVKFELDTLIRFQTKVRTATLLDNGEWFIAYEKIPKSNESNMESSHGTLVARKLVIATGLTSEPSMPTFAGHQNFQGHLFHAKQLKERTEEMLDAKKVVVVGGNKSAWDACYNYATSGAQVHMVIRPTGGGPCWVWRPLQYGFLKTSISRLSSTRFCTWFDPHPFGNAWTGVRRFLHRTRVGRMISSLFWTCLGYCAVSAVGYGDPRLAMLRPWTSTFWMGNSLSILNYDSEWFELVRNGNIVIHHAEVVSLEETRVHLSNGTALEADTLVSCTGWKALPAINFQPDGINSIIGLPRTSSFSIRALGAEESMLNDRSLQQAFPNAEAEPDDAEIMTAIKEHLMRDYIELAEKPIRKLPHNTRLSDDGQEVSIENNDGLQASISPTPYRLYRFLVPPSRRFLELRNLAFIGMHRSNHAVIVAQAQALWITAFMLGELTLPDPQRTRYEAYFHAEYERVRHPKETGGSGEQFPDLIFDSIPYVDSLLEDLGLPSQRKSSWWGNVFEPHFPRDYRNLVQEWQDRLASNSSE